MITKTRKRPAPVAEIIPDNIVDAMNGPFAPWFVGGDCWDGWRALMRAAYGLPLSDAEREFLRMLAERDPPGRRVKELWICAGRRAGKDSIASLIAAHSAARFDPSPLRRGERSLVLCTACDKAQGRIILNYTRSYFSEIPALRNLVQRETQDGFELRNHVDIVVSTNSFRAVRGRPILCGILDEVAFYLDENSASPDVELYNALKPGMATLPDSMLIGISSPYRRAGLLFKKFKELYGRNVSDKLFIKSPTIRLNPRIDPDLIEQAMAEDPAAAMAEWGGEFRSDLETFISAEVIDAAVVPGRHELPPVSGVQYVGFVDPSGGSSDSMTMAIAHMECERALLDCVREIRPPFSPDDVAREFAGTFYSYGITTIRGDRYGGMWPRERFAAHGIDYQTASKTKSEYYLSFLPLLNAGRVELLDNKRMTTQLANLERRTARGGRDSVDHPVGQHDDIVNSAAAAIVTAAEGAGRPRMSYVGLDNPWRTGTREPQDLTEEDWSQISARICCDNGVHQMDKTQ